MRISLLLCPLLLILSACDEYYTVVTPADLINSTQPIQESTSLCLANSPGGSIDPSGFWDGDGSIGDPFQVCTAAQFNLISSSSNKHFVLINNIDLSFLDQAAFNMISLVDGSLNGGGYEVKNLTLSDAAENDWGQGLFKLVSFSEISNIKFDNIDISFPAANAVGLIGEVSASTFNHIEVTNLKVAGKIYTGGLAGFMESSCSPSCRNSNVKNTTVNADVTGTYYIGGIAGWSMGGYGITRVIMDQVQFHGVMSGIEAVGGIGGEVGETEIDNATVVVSMASGERLGGITGRMYSSEIYNSTANVTLSGTTEIGGIVGSLNHCTLDNVTSSGTVNGTTDVGGIIGDNRQFTVLSNSTTNVAVTGTVARAGRIIGYNKSTGTTITSVTSTGSLNGNGAGDDIGTTY